MPGKSSHMPAILLLVQVNIKLSDQEEVQPEKVKELLSEENLFLQHQKPDNVTKWLIQQSISLTSSNLFHRILTNPAEYLVVFQVNLDMYPIF